MPTPSTTDPTPTTPHPTQTAVAGPPAGSSQPETDGQPPAARHDQAEIPPECPAKPDAPATMQAGARTAVQASKGHLANARAPRPADHGDRGKRRGREGMAATAPHNLRPLRVSAGCVQPQPSRQPGERRWHPSGFACRRVCRRTPGSSGPRRTPSWATKSSMRVRTRMVRVRKLTSCRRCRISARSLAQCLRTAAAAARGAQQQRGQPG